ncbi:hypothetical protein [Streptomyces sp. NPDC050548]|uniref:hypothetical protein n=1 Tax=Streptomyces sp. NPDC050548 TaxID=3365629 RepID=UPI00379576A5
MPESTGAKSAGRLVAITRAAWVCTRMPVTWWAPKSCRSAPIVDDQAAVLLGVGLLIAPVIVPAAAAGRLGAARREQRLAALRLAGAAPRRILAMTGV